MLADSFFYSKFLMVAAFLKQYYFQSMFYFLYQKLVFWLGGYFDNSAILNFLRSNWDRYFTPRHSRIIRAGNRILTLPGKAVKSGTGNFAKQLRHSFLLRLLCGNFDVLLVYFLFFAIPFLPTMLLAFVSLAAITLYVLCRLMGRKRVGLPGFLGITLGLFAFSYAASSFTSYHFPKSIQVMIIFLSFLLLFFVIRDEINTERKLNVLINFFLISGVFVALYGIYQYLTGVEMQAAWVDSKSFEDIKARAYATFANPNVLGEYLIIVSSVTVGMMWKAKNYLAKGFYFVCFGIMVVGLAATNSRGAMLGLLLSAGLFVLLAEKRLIPLGILFLLAMPFLLPDSLWQRLASVATLSDSSSLYRVSIYKGSLDMLSQYWLTGIGVDAFNSLYPIFSYEAAHAYHAHNLFLHEFLELGIAGFLFFIMTLGLYFQRLYYGISHAPRRFQVLIASIFGGFAGVLLQGMVDHLWFDYRIILLFWAVLGLGIAAVKIGVRTSHEQK